jgi:hypothetical protein
VVDAAAAAPSTTTATSTTSTAGGDAQLAFLQTLTWDDVIEDDNGVVNGVLGLQWNKFTAKQLRTICSTLAIRGLRTMKREDYIKTILDTYANKKAYKNKDGAPSKTRKEVQCTFRLMNILFSDKFADDFATLGNIANRALLDTGKAGNDEHFWIRVKEAFSEPHPNYDYLDFLSDDVLAAQDHIDPGKIVDHDWKKLRSMWKGVNADYKAALTRFTMSGTHDDNFFTFCNGKLDVYYLRKKLDEKPQLHKSINADLPPECALASDVDLFTGGLELHRRSSSLTSSGTKKLRDEQGVNDTIRDFKDSREKMYLGKEKERTKLWETEEVRREKEEWRRDNEEARRQKEVAMREEELSIQSRKVKFDEWTSMDTTIRQLRNDIRNPTHDEDEKEEMKKDMEDLKRRKRELAVELGIVKK